MDDDIVINRALLKAIGADSRIFILKSLANGRKTQSQLAGELGLSSPTVLEHLEHLSSAGLVDKIDEGRKWKYYELTAIGRKLAAPKPGFPARAILLLAFGLVFMAFSSMSLLYPAPSPEPLFYAASATSNSQGEAMPLLGAAAVPINNSLGENVTIAESSASQQEPNAMLIYAVLALGAAMFIYGVYGLARRMGR